MTDVIGDIHGHADALEKLLQKLGYKKEKEGYRHPSRKVLFLGDYIDRGPKIRETLEIVKAMVDAGNAVALMGNHEYNALCFHFPEMQGGHLRKHLIKNIIQHYETLKQFQNLQKEYNAYLEWFKTLPLYYETVNFRAVHACWDEPSIGSLRKELANDRLTEELIYKAVTSGTVLNNAVETTLKGKEMRLPDGLKFKDKDGNERKEFRIKWWENPEEMTYKKISIEPITTLPERPLLKGEPDDYYYEEEKIVFFGHYWLKGEPYLFRDNICCLDFSIAKNGYLAAYRIDDESRLDLGKFVYV